MGSWRKEGSCLHRYSVSSYILEIKHESTHLNRKCMCMYLLVCSEFSDCRFSQINYRLVISHCHSSGADVPGTIYWSTCVFDFIASVIYPTGGREGYASRFQYM